MVGKESDIEEGRRWKKTMMIIGENLSITDPIALLRPLIAITTAQSYL